MFDTMGAFTKQFTPTEGGYLYYPSRKGGGKLVSQDEFIRLVSEWERIAGPRGRWKIVGLILVTIVLWTILTRSFGFPDWSDKVLTFGIVFGLSGWLLWVSFAPRRLVRNRPDVAPAKPASKARRDARAMLNWPFVIFALAISGGIFFGHLSSADRSPASWAWMIGSGSMLALYVWIAFRKFMDARS